MPAHRENRAEVFKVSTTTILDGLNRWRTNQRLI